jgi:phosphoglycerol transferase MdoB-like AlkP superfamily enzyme
MPTIKTPGAGPMRPMLHFLLAALVFLGAFRLVLSILFWERLAAVGAIAPVFLTGLRLDLQLLAYLLIPALALLPFIDPRTRTGRGAASALRLWLTIWAGVLVFMECATPSFMGEYGVRPNRVFVEYLIYPREVFGTLWKAYRVSVLVTLLVSVAAAAAMWRLMGGSPPPARWSWPRRLMVFPLIVLAAVLAARSGLGHRPANPSIAAFSRDPLVNDLALNATYSVLYAAYRMKDEEDAAEVYGRMPREEVIRRVRAGMGLGPEAFTDPRYPTLHRQAVAAPRQRPLNLVIILEESLGARYVEPLGGLPVTPELAALSRQGLWFERLYATGTRSVRGIEAVVTGFLPTPARSVVKLVSAGRPFFTLAELLRRHGYTSLFVYGGESHFDNMAGFFLRHGFDRVIDEKDYADPRFKGTWGVSDEDLFERAHREFEAQGERLFFGLVFTSSYHSPFEIPESRLPPEAAGLNSEHRAIRYADLALGQFFRLARASTYWRDTVFLVVADHDNRVSGASLVPIARFHIPGLILGADILPRRVAALASQIDLPPTLLGLMGLTAEHPMTGRDLSGAPPAGGGRAIMQYDRNQAYMAGNRVVVLQPDLPPAQFIWDGAGLQPAPATDPELAADALAHALWPSLAYREGLYALPPAGGSSSGAAP